MSIADKLTRLAAAREDIIDALDDKGVTATGHGFEDFPDDIASITSGTGNLQTKSVTPTESAQTITADSGYDGLEEVDVAAISSSYVGSGITRRSSSDLTVSGDTVTAPSGYYGSSASKAVASGTAGTPTASKGTVSNHSISVTPSVNNASGYITGGTKTGTAVSVSASELVSGTYTVDSSGTKDVTNYASASVPAGTAGTPSASKGAVSNHSISVTPSVTNTTGFITGGTTTGTAVTVSASELVSGSKNIVENGTDIDVTNYATVNVEVPTEPWRFSRYWFDHFDDGVYYFIGAAYDDISDIQGYVIIANDDLSSPSDGTTIAIASDSLGIAAWAYNNDNVITEYEDISLTFTKSPNASMIGVEVRSSYLSLDTSLPYDLYIIHGEKHGFSFRWAEGEVAANYSSVSFTVDDVPSFYLCGRDDEITVGQTHEVQVVKRSNYNGDGEIFAITAWATAFGTADDFTDSYSNNTLTITASGTNKFADAYYFLYYLVAEDTSTVPLQSKTVTPTTSTQYVNPDDGFSGLSFVTVYRIPTQYIIPTGNKSITSNGTDIDVAAYSTVSVAVSGSIPDGDELEYGTVQTLSDLTGTTWYFNEYPTISIELYLLDCMINFTSNSESYFNLMVEYRSQSVCDVTYNALGMYWNGAWLSEAYRTISITGGTDATNADLITWLQANATRIS